jgi:hypothetical protein
MTTSPDKLLSIARESGGDECFGNDIEGHENAVIVTEAVLATFAERIRQEERERCARIADEHCGDAADAPFKDYENTHIAGYMDASNDIAAAIRSISTTESKDETH